MPIAYVAFLDAQPQVDKARKIGAQGYCMGGALVVRSAATLPARIGAGASFHGGGLVTDKPDSPHLLAPRIAARMYFGVAMNDDQRQPEAKDKLKEAFASGQGAGAGGGLPGAPRLVRLRHAERGRRADLQRAPRPSAPGRGCSSSTRPVSPRAGAVAGSLRADLRGFALSRSAQ